MIPIYLAVSTLYVTQMSHIYLSIPNINYFLVLVQFAKSAESNRERIILLKKALHYLLLFSSLTLELALLLTQHYSITEKYMISVYCWDMVLMLYVHTSFWIHWVYLVDRARLILVWHQKTCSITMLLPLPEAYLRLWLRWVLAPSTATRCVLFVF